MVLPNLNRNLHRHRPERQCLWSDPSPNLHRHLLYQTTYELDEVGLALALNPNSMLKTDCRFWPHPNPNPQPNAET